MAEELIRYEGVGPVVAAVPRGGVPIAIEVAWSLSAVLDLVITRKIPIPSEPEAGYGAVTEDGTVVLNGPLVRQLGLTDSQIERQAVMVREEIARRDRVLRGSLPAVGVEGRLVILTDDGLASGYTMLAAVKSVRRRGASEIVVAVPVASERAYDLVKPQVDDLVCLTIGQEGYFAVASYYRYWHDLTDDEVLEAIDQWKTRRTDAGKTGPRAA